MIAVTSRNGTFLSLDPTHIERVESAPETVLHLVDGTKYLIQESFDDLLRLVRDHHSELTVMKKRLAGGTAEIADNAQTVRNSPMFIERRQYSRDGNSQLSAADRRLVTEPRDVDAD